MFSLPLCEKCKTTLQQEFATATVPEKSEIRHAAHVYVCIIEVYVMDDEIFARDIVPRFRLW